MIFNPLFLSENGNSQMLVSKSNKLSNNKYLFSDIVKVVMNPEREQKKLLETNVENIFNSETNIIPGNDQIAEKLKLEILSVFNSEKTKIDLVDVLPEDIAQLLINDDTIVNNDKAISYLSKEQLNSDLQLFLNGLVGKELLKDNITNETGVFLSLEDSKSAVNIELIKEPNKNRKDKIIVQTLVVPEKSKLISHLNNSENNIVKINKTELANNINKELSAITNLSHNEIIENSKPTLSVFSFKYDKDEVNNLASDIKIPRKTKINFDLVNNSNKNSLTEIVSSKEQKAFNKISFIARDYKEQNINDTVNPKKTNHLTSHKTIDNSFDRLQEKSPKKDYNVSKITILEKQPGYNNIKDDVDSKKFNSSLKKIDFVEKTNNETNNIRLIKNDITTGKVEQTSSIKKTATIQGTSTETKSNNTKESLRILSSNSATQFKNVKDKSENYSKINTNNETKDFVKGNIREVKTSNRIQVEPEKIKFNIDQNSEVKTESSRNERLVNGKENVVSKDTKQINSSQKDFKTIDTDKKVGTENFTKSNTIPKDENMNIKLVEKDVIKNETKINDKAETLINNKNTNVTNKANTGKVENKTEEFKSTQNTETNERNGFSKKNINEKTEFKNEAKSKSINQLTANQTEKIKASYYNINNETIVGNEIKEKTLNNESVKIKNNKKISVNVKGGIKTVSDKNQDGSGNISVGKNEESTASLKHGNSEASTNDNNKQTTYFNNSLNIKNIPDNNFQATLNNVGMKTQEIPSIQSPEYESSLDQRIIKSSEVVKEISRFIIQKEKGNFSFKIEPEHLGKMKITLDTIDNILKATIEVDNEHSKQLVERNLNKLYTQLRENGVELNSLNISLGYSKEGNSEEEISNKQSNRSSDNNQARETEEEEKTTKSLGYNTYEYLA